MQTVNGRIPPALPPAAMKSYVISAPLRTHWNQATCADVDCPQHLHGWESHIDERTSLGQRQAAYIRQDSGRKFTEAKNELGITVFSFEAGQRCFAQHRARNMRDDNYIERGGDHRAVIGTPRLHKTPDNWTESFALNQERIKLIAERG
jgi:hypothetical protein